MLLDAELAALYGVTTKTLNQAVKRNSARFPKDFIFRLSPEETESLNRSQIVTGSQNHRDPRFPPLRLHGTWRHHGRLHTQQPARNRNERLYRSRLCTATRAPCSNAALARKLNELEAKLKTHDKAIVSILSAIRELTNPPRPKARGIGFTARL